MIRSAILLLILLTTGIAHAQTHDQPLIRSKKVQKAKICSRAYVGFSTGINNPVGFIGPQVDIAITPEVSVGTGITHNTGTKNLVLPGVATIYGDQEVIIDQYPQTNGMISGYYFVPLGRIGRNRFHVQAGYSVPITERARFDSNYPLTAEGEDQIYFLSPGGIIVGFGFSFGFGSI
jgi:hypothetical protein